jgi:hypothetical protein
MFPELSYYRNPRRNYSIKVKVGSICNGISKENLTPCQFLGSICACIIVEQVKGGIAISE